MLCLPVECSVSLHAHHSIHTLQLCRKTERCPILCWCVPLPYLFFQKSMNTNPVFVKSYISLPVSNSRVLIMLILFGLGAGLHPG